jgi:hypothetical protein
MYLPIEGVTMANPELERDIENFIGNVLKRKYGVTVDEVHGMFDSDAAMERFADRLATLPAPREEPGRGQPSHAQFIEDLRHSLKWQIARRFGNLPNAAASQIDDAGEADLRRWLDRMANAGSVDAVLAG